MTLTDPNRPEQTTNRPTTGPYRLKQTPNRHQVLGFVRGSVWVCEGLLGPGRSLMGSVRDFQTLTDPQQTLNRPQQTLTDLTTPKQSPYRHNHAVVGS